MTAPGVDRQRWLVSALERYERPLVGYAYRLLGDLERARDVVQDTFLRLCQQDRAKLDGRVKEWLFAVCRHRAIDCLRKERRMDALGDREPATVEPDLPAQRDEERRVLARIRELPPREREVLRLKFQEGLSYRQISAVTELSVTNVGFLLHRAIRTLRRQLGDGVAATGRNPS